MALPVRTNPSAGRVANGMEWSANGAAGPSGGLVTVIMSWKTLAKTNGERYPTHGTHGVVGGADHLHDAWDSGEQQQASENKSVLRPAGHGKNSRFRREQSAGISLTGRRRSAKTDVIATLSRESELDVPRWWTSP